MTTVSSAVNLLIVPVFQQVYKGPPGHPDSPAEANPSDLTPLYPISLQSFLIPEDVTEDSTDSETDSDLSVSETDDDATDEDDATGNDDKN